MDNSWRTDGLSPFVDMNSRLEMDRRQAAPWWTQTPLNQHDWALQAMHMQLASRDALMAVSSVANAVPGLDKRAAIESYDAKHSELKNQLEVARGLNTPLAQQAALAYCTEVKAIGSTIKRHLGILRDDIPALGQFLQNNDPAKGVNSMVTVVHAVGFVYPYVPAQLGNKEAHDTIKEAHETISQALMMMGMGLQKLHHPVPPRPPESNVFVPQGGVQVNHAPPLGTLFPIPTLQPGERNQNATVQLGIPTGWAPPRGQNAFDPNPPQGQGQGQRNLAPPSTNPTPNPSGRRRPPR